MPLVEAIWPVLVADASPIQALIGDRIYPMAAPRGMPFPFVVYRCTGEGERVVSLTGPSGLASKEYELLCVADDPKQAIDLAEKVRVAIDGKSGTFGGITVQAIFVDPSATDDAEYEVRGMEEFVFARSWTVTVWHEEEVES